MESKPTYSTDIPSDNPTTATYPDVVLMPLDITAELQAARRAVIQAGIALEDALGLLPEQRAIITRHNRRILTRPPE